MTGGRDLFESWRLLLTVVCSIYALVVTGKSLWDWVVYFSAPDKTTTLMRSYVIATLLRIRVRRFAGELSLIAFWSSALLLILLLHRKMAFS
ncbi:MAG TPA: hypothetical protein VMV81_08005 [Phycisphaerae bacterium]|nr:hypothetical protein [Phycisphaerae bacterium]